jgi:stage II sporulation protein D
VLSGGPSSVRISASSFRFAVGRLLGWNTLRSELYEVVSNPGRISFDGMGAGHGAGLCQLGAEQMGREKRSYREILAFYYPGTSVGLTTQGLRWQKMTGERLAMLSTEPSKDVLTLTLAEKVLRDVARRVGRPAPALEIRVYPDVETFRNATGEPGWVAARASGTRIDLQPAGVLRARGVLESTLRHELAHAVLESGARSGLPVWFREGLAAYFTVGPSGEGAAAPPDRQLRQTNNEASARSANVDAARQVSALIRRYGEGTVLGWLTAGLPREVTNASAKQAPTKSK